MWCPENGLQFFVSGVFKFCLRSPEFLDPSHVISIPACQRATRFLLKVLDILVRFISLFLYPNPEKDGKIKNKQGSFK